MNPPPVLARWLLRLAIASVWFYQGIWHKVLAFDGSHRRMIESVLGERLGAVSCIALGIFEGLLGVAVVLGLLPGLLAWVQIGLLAAMNAAGLLSAFDQITDPPGLLTMNSVFAVAIWINAWFARQVQHDPHVG